MSKKSTTYNKRKPNNSNTKHEIVSIHQFSKLAMTFWIGGSWMLAIVILPLLFKTLDQITASDITGQILNILAYIGIVCLLIALVEVIINHKLSLIKTRRFWYILIMGTIVIVNYFAIFPMIYRLRQKLAFAAHQILSIQNNMFDFWHSLSAILFLIICGLGVLYLIEM